MKARSVQWSGLDCVSVTGTETPNRAVVLCHGFGAPGTDLVDLAPSIAQCAPALADVGYVFPAAPLELVEFGAHGGRAWWEIDMFELMEAIQFGRLRDLRNQCPPELPEMRRRIVDLLTEIGQRWNIGTERIVLGGFSQGAMLSTAVALQERLPLAGVCALSGTLLCESQWRQGAAETAALSFFQSHGRYDPVLPFANAEALRDLLTGQGHAVDFVPFDGQHEIPSAVVRRLANWLVERLA